MKKIISLLLLLAMVLSLCACGEKAPAAPAEEAAESGAPVEEAAPSPEELAAEAAELYYSGDYEAAFEALEELEDSGNETAALLLGLCRYYGYGTEAEPELAAGILMPLAESGNFLAAHTMAKASFIGNGTKRDPEKAEELFKAAFDAAEKLKSDELFKGSANYVLADCCAKGLGTGQDSDKAFAAAQAAAEGRLTAFESFELAHILSDSAQLRRDFCKNELDEMGFVKGLEEMKEKLEQRKLGLEAPEANPQYAPYDQAQAEQYKEDIKIYEDILLKSELAEAEIALAEQLCADAFEAVSALSEKDNISALRYMGDYYFGALSPKSQDYAKALDYYLIAADMNNADAQAQLGLMYQDGLGVEISYEQAMEWNNRAAQQGNAQGQAQIGYLYHMGLGVTQNLDEAGRWYARAAEQGDVWAEGKLAETEITNPRVVFEFHA